MKIVFMGTPHFASFILKAIPETEAVVGVVTQPDRPKGRGRKVEASPVKTIAQKQGYQLFQPSDLNEGLFQDWLRVKAPDVIIVAAYGRILPEWILSLPPQNCLNIHASLLPLYRGAAPIEHALMQGDKQTGITIMRMNAGLDEGDIVFQKTLDIAPEDTAGLLSEKLATLGAELLLRTLKGLKENKLKFTPQRHAQATFAPPLKKSDCLINWQLPAEDIHNLVRALNPRWGAYTYLQNKVANSRGKLLKIWKTQLLLGQSFPSASKGKPGEITDIIKEQGWVMATGAGRLLVEEVQEEGKRKVRASEYIRGNKLIVPGAILG